MSGLCPDHSIVTVDPNSSPNEKRFVDSTETLEAHHPTRFDRLHDAADFVRVGRDHKSRCAFRSPLGRNEVSVGINRDFINVWSEFVSELTDDRVFVTGNPVDCSIFAKTLFQPSLQLILVTHVQSVLP
jgi:hypothetical protein